MATVSLAQARATIDTCLSAKHHDPGRRIASAVCDGGAIIGAVGIAGEAGDLDGSIAVAAVVATGLVADVE